MDLTTSSWSLLVEGNLTTVYNDQQYGNISNALSDERLKNVNFVNALIIARNIYVPAIALIGLAGNFISLAVFSMSHLRHVSSSGYLASLACADNLFLLSMFITWLDGIVPILVNRESCSFIMYVTYVSSFLSVWYVVCFTGERYIAICHPLHAPMIFSKLKEKFVIISFAVLSCIIYNFAFWTIDVSEFSHRKSCSMIPSIGDIMYVITWIDTVITMVLPFLLIVFMNVRIVWSVYRYQRKREKMVQATARQKDSALKNRSQRRITRMLLLVSTTFLVLNLPSHVSRLEQLLSTSSHNYLFKRLIHEIVLMLYYSTFSINFFLYAIYGKHFKKSLSILVRNLCRRKKKFNSHDRWRSEVNRTSMTSLHK
ncbi:neuropeptides capa receptor-like [Gigantopelta aegis]|uniref:neuropeptides capa receptor-like n=1 Tax=Gigantopelta aegis TaxID=1735272 RepID=UPI001B887ECE|nr:neuropeptides capa receptor-like [Gigantopelta aegis]